MPSTISPLYTLFFLTLEPLTALAGFIAAACYPAHYLHLTSPQTTSASGPVPPATAITLAQLANLYLLFAINEALVLRATRDVAVWRALLLGLLIADVGHLWSVKVCALALLGLDGERTLKGRRRGSVAGVNYC